MLYANESLSTPLLTGSVFAAVSDMYFLAQNITWCTPKNVFHNKNGCFNVGIYCINNIMKENKVLKIFYFPLFSLYGLGPVSVSLRVSQSHSPLKKAEASLIQVAIATEIFMLQG